MMRLICFLFLPLIVFSQDNSILIRYKAIYNTELPTTKNGLLYVNKAQDKTIYFTQKSKDQEVGEEDEVDVSVKLASGKARYNYFDYKKNTLITREDIVRESKRIKEEIPHFDWQLLQETKTVNNNTLNKATCYFRGRRYIAWYNLAIPIKAGPWKFHGLPGIIHEVYDETKRYNWFLQEVTRDTYDFNNKELSYTNENTISLKEYVGLKSKSMDQFDQKMLTKLPRGASMVKKKTFRTGFEIKYEWEEPTEEE